MIPSIANKGMACYYKNEKKEKREVIYNVNIFQESA